MSGCFPRARKWGDKVAEFREYTKKDFLEGTEPYEVLYKYREDKFVLMQLLEQMAEIAAGVGVKGFKTLFKRYCEAQKKEAAGKYIPNATNFDGQPLELDCGDWIADDNGIRLPTPLGDMLACIHPIVPVLRLVNIDTNTEKLQLAYRKGGVWRKTIADKRTLAAASSIIALADVGVAVNSENAKWLVRYLHDAENLNYDRIEEKNSVGRLGWVEGHGFSPYVENLVFDGDAACKGLFESVKSSGSYEKWLELAKGIRRESIYGRILMAASFASVLVKPLNCLPFFLHLWGGTEAGKTVGEMLAASLWADPRVGRYIQTFNSTIVGKERAAAFVGNLPLILDELQIANGQSSFDKDIYMLSEGVGRTRGNKQGGVDLTPTWSNCIITNGEMPLASSASGGGAVNRIIEIECEEALFSDPKHVADTLLENYGFAGKKALDWLDAYDPDFATVRALYKVYMQEFDKKDTTGKQSMAMSLILAADFVLTNAVFEDDKALKPEDVQRFLKTKQEVSVHERAYEYIYQTLVANKHRFGESENDKNEVWGTTDQYYFYVIRNYFDQICNDGGYNPKAILSWMKRSGKIEVSKGNTKTKRVNGEPVPCVWLIKPKEDDRGFEQVGLEDKEGNDCPF